ncbi:NAD-dependent dehydratase [Sulfuriferula sp. AH1]|uniref:NAD-dependent epimerase/dehydratase family protein n=1 Tax=Sulfuriferula sp. AH1 TaxID=1985873 RepID=UPI000B3B155E|nr:NAD(P)-dependent oxidoreductase [Sulfuriferula sp. AH1]ARU32303.1 NAD-dependent dehydratase [Sulfuriferula sp. AH1]
MTEPRVALVTGGTGFVGANLVRKLVNDGWDVHAVVRPGSDLSMLADIEQTIQVHVHDGSTEQLIEIVKFASPQIVFHLASLFLAQHAPQDIAPLINSNLLFSTQLVEAMSVNGVRHLINTGTSWQHYENQDYSPVCLYAATKQAFEAVLTYYVDVARLAAVTLQLFDTYGPNDPRAKLFTLLRKTARSGEPLLMSPGEQLIDLVYIDDVLAAYLLAAERLLQNRVGSHEIYAVTSGQPVRLRDLVETYGRITGQTLAVEWGARPYRPREVMLPWNRGTVVPGWEPKVGLAAGIALMEQQSPRLPETIAHMAGG